MRVSAATKIFTVTEITTEIKNLVESHLSNVWLKGEVSNYKLYGPSGHAYFTLKDEGAQISAVMFKGYVKLLKFHIEDGMNIICHGRITIYKQRGQYQIQIEQIEPDGIGALQLAFEQLKEKLKKEGMFDASRKKPLPVLPRKVGIITSLQGAAVHDMITILRRRFPNIEIIIYPVKVQGEGAAPEIAAAVKCLSENNLCDVMIVGRGGGSLEDLWAFNEEVVARAIFNSQIPVISAVGHETDFTIADFTADLRAPTPSAAAELCTPVKNDITQHIGVIKKGMLMQMQKMILSLRKEITLYVKSIPTPKAILDHHLLRVGDLEDRLYQAISLRIKDFKTRAIELKIRITNPKTQIDFLRQNAQVFKKNLNTFLGHQLLNLKHHLSKQKLKLELLNPQNILKRGFAMARSVDGRMITRKEQTRDTERINLMFYDGEVKTKIID
ncbi:MAG: exodeoxyribonuclease VII large subunit [Deltaproteobacteria bacterium]|nr:exodeoxyribonuclease VII large subunit [Deltaproteobacteria bacterium]